MEPAESAENNRAIDGGEDGLGDGRLEESGLLPLHDRVLGKASGEAELAGGGGNEEVGAVPVVGG